MKFCVRSSMFSMPACMPRTAALTSPSEHLFQQNGSHVMVVEHRSVIAHGGPSSKNLELHGHGVRLLLDSLCGGPRSLADLDIALVRRNADQLVGVDNRLDVGPFLEETVCRIHWSPFLVSCRGRSNGQYPLANTGCCILRVRAGTRLNAQNAIIPSWPDSSTSTTRHHSSTW